MPLPCSHWPYLVLESQLLVLLPFVIPMNCMPAGTDAQVYVQLRGAKGLTTRTTLKSKRADFERGKTDEFEVELEEVGEVQQVLIGQDGSGLLQSASWHVDRVKLLRVDKKEEILFPCGQWFDKKLGDGQMERWLDRTENALPLTNYKVTTLTSDLDGAGTDAQVYIELVGKLGHSRRVTLQSKRKDFERGNTDTFNIECEDVGELEKLLVGQDGSGICPTTRLNSRST